MLKKHIVGLLRSLVLTAGAANAQEVDIAVSADSFAYAPLYVAMELGTFDKVGLTVNIEKIGSGAKAAAAMIGGDADIYIGSTPTVINAQMQGVDVVAFAAITTQYTSSVAVSKNWAADHNVTADSPLQEKLKALKGIRVSVTGPGSGTDSVIRYLASQANLDPDKDMTIVPLGNTPSSHLATMQQGMVDGIVYSPPLPQIAEKEQGAVILLDNNIGAVDSLDGFFYIAAIARKDWLESNPETAAKFAAGIQLALDSIRAPEASERAMTKVAANTFPDLDPEVFRKIWSGLGKMTPLTVEITKTMFDRVIAYENLFNENKTDPENAGKFFVDEYAQKGLEIARSYE